MNTRILSVAAAVIALGLALAGCSAGGDSGSAAAPFDPADLVSTTPAGTGPVDLVTWGLTTEPGTVDPVKAGVDSEYLSVANMCDTLLRVQPDFSLQPGLATSVEYTSDTTLVIELRSDVTFWDGAPLTAGDVAFSLQRSADPASQSVNTDVFTAVDTITATGPLEVTVTFTTPDSQFRNALAGPAGYIVEQAFTQAAGDAFGTPTGGIMCTGPFAFQSWTAGQSLTMTANPGYWDGVPLVKTLRLSFIDSDATLTSALLSGDLDGAFDAPSANARTLIDSGVGNLYVGPSTASISFGPTTDQGPAADPRVREALDLAIDKPSFIAAVLNGYGAPLKTLDPPLAWQGDPAVDVYRQGYDALEDNSAADLDRARELIAEAHPEKRTLVFAIAAGDDQSLREATVVQAAAQSIGLDMDIRQLQGSEFNALFYDAGARQGIDFLGTTGYLDTPGVLLYPSLFALPDALFNWSKYSDDEVTSYLAEARSTLDPTASAEAFVKAQARYAPARLQVSLAEQYTRVFLNKRLTGVTTSFAYIATPWALHLGAANG